MSTKTLRKRIALVAVAALGAGVLSVAPANAAAPNDLAVNDVTITTVAATTPGVCSITSTSGAQAIVLLPGTSFVLTTGSGANGESIVAKAAGDITFSATSGYDAATTTTASSTASPYAATDDTLTVTAGSVGSGTVTFSSTSSSAAVDVISVSVVAACANNVFSATKSFIQVRNDTNAADSNLDETAGLVSQNGEIAYVAILFKDAYNQALTGSGTVTATATNGAIVKWDGTPDLQTSTAFLATRGGSAAEVHIAQGTANKDKALTTTVTISLDGVAVGTKTVSFQGIAAKIVVTDVTVGKVGDSGSARGAWSAVVQDAAGNNLFQKTVANDATANSAASSGTIAAIAQSSISQDATGSGAKPKAGATTNSSQNGIFTCAASGTTTLFVEHVINAVTGTSVKGSFTANCGGALDTWTIALDKASYAPGDIATLTVSGKDSKGFAVNATDTLGALEYSFGGMTAVTAPTEADKFTAGAKTYQFSVGTSEGAFVGTFKIAGATDKTAKTVQYKVAGAAGVSNADVLKAIVSLIASINKQIAALQKALLRR
jgi:hypothetical protein